MKLKKLMSIYIISLVILIRRYLLNASDFYMLIVNIKNSRLQSNLSFAIEFILVALGVIVVTFFTINECVERNSAIKLIKRQS